MCQIEFFWVGIDSDNLICFCLMCVLNYCQINCVKIKYGNRIIWLDFSCVVYCVNIGGYVIVQQVDVFMVCFWINFCQRYFCDYGVFIECRVFYVVIKWLFVVRKMGGVVWYQVFILGFVNCNIEVSFVRMIEFIFVVFCGVKWDYMVVRFDVGYVFIDFNYNVGFFVIENYWEYIFWVIVGEGKCVGMVNVGMGDFNQYFIFFWWCNVNFNDFQWFIGSKCNGSM